MLGDKSLQKLISLNLFMTAIMLKQLADFEDRAGGVCVCVYVGVGGCPLMPLFCGFRVSFH